MLGGMAFQMAAVGCKKAGGGRGGVRGGERGSPGEDRGGPVQKNWRG